MPNQEQINIRSEEVQEILSYVPNWMIRFGNALIFLIMVLLFVISYFVRYPDLVDAEVIVTTNNPPVKVMAKIAGKMDALLVDDNQEVNQNTVLAVMENSANYRDVFLLQQIMDTLKVDRENFEFPLEVLPLLELGSVASDFAIFETNYYEYLLNKRLNPFSNKLYGGKISVEENSKRLAILKAQKEINEKELALKRNDFNRSKKLYEQQLISEQAFEQKELDFLQARKTSENINASISSLNETINISRNNLSSTEIDKIQNELKLLKNAIQAYFQLKKAIQEWENQFVLKSPIEGKVSYLSFWNKTQSVGMGDVVFSVIPSNEEGYVGKIKAPMANSGKLKIGQSVNIRLHNYPDQEFGVLRGIIDNISLVPDQKGFYHIDVIFPKGLVTTYNKPIAFKYEMRGRADIITDNLRLIERFFNHVRYFLDS